MSVKVEACYKKAKKEKDCLNKMLNHLTHYGVGKSVITLLSGSHWTNSLPTPLIKSL